MNDPDYRAHGRIPRHQTISIVPLHQYQKDGLWATLTSVDISENGILFESSRAYMIGEHYMIRLTGKEGRWIDEKIEIVRVEEVITDRHYNIGAAFVDTVSERLKKLAP